GTYGQIQLNADGSYTYTLTSPVTSDPKSNDGSHTELGKDSFSYTVTDANGNTQQGTILINIVDDVPSASADVNEVDEGGTAAGNVLTDGTADVFGADGAAAGGGVVGVAVGDTGAPVSGNLGAPLTGQYGALILNADGSYSYTSNANGTPPQGATDVFTYTIQDGDGDLSTTTLTITVPGTGEPEGPELIVGSNADDNPDQTTAHTVPSDDGPNRGEIQGGRGSDILVGDTGSNRLVAGQTANLILVLDSSGSMSRPIQFNGSTISRMEALKLATLSLLDSLADSGADNVRINLIDFDGTASSLGVFDLVINGVKNEAGLVAAKAAINSMSDGGITNYEDGLQTAADWINSTDTDAPYDNADLNQVLFISDGQPNAWNNNSGGVNGGQLGYSDTTKALGEVLGSDGSNEVQQIIGSGWNIEAIGIGLNEAPVLLNAAKLSSTDLNSGSDNDRGYFIEAANGVNLALVSAWSASGQLVDTSRLVNTPAAGTEQFLGVKDGNGAAGMGNGEMLRFDFSGGTDYDGNGTYNTRGFNGPLASEATFDFRGFSSATEVSYRVFYTDGTSSAPLSVNGAQAGVNIVAPSGKIIDYIEFKAVGGSSDGYIRLNSVTAISALAILDQIEGENGQAVNVGSAEELNDAVGSLGGGQELNPAGSDTITGGDGDDIIFGDVLFTDSLAAVAGLNTEAGDGWLVFQQLEAGLGQAGYENWTRADTLAYIRDPANHDELAQESGRAGGNDILLGGAGNDIIFGQEGNDLINGGAGNNLLSGGSGDDIFQFIEADAGSINTITDFGNGKDVLDLSELLIGEENGNLSEYLLFSRDGTDTLLEVSPTGTGAGDQQFIRFENVDLLDAYGAGSSSELINAMLNDQTLIVDQQ
ncbi:type I secretion C-terminal target domain-containing protein, partial [Oceanisphaera marina]|uniref:type I secretion C-terminal target domain-containing protein n=1 Tax=Oceanisphaera marina TaxID=2017550 RepID=UPI00166E6F77